MPPRKNKPLPPAGDDDQELRTDEGTGEPMVAVEGPELEAEPIVVKELQPGEMEAAIGQLGDAVARNESNYDLSEEAHLSAIEGAEEAASRAVLLPDSLVWDTRDFLLEQIKRRPKPWQGCSGGEQRDIGAACEHAAQELVRKIVEALASGGQPSVRVLLGQITLGDDIKIAGKVRVMAGEDEDAAVLFLHRAHGKHVMLILASKDEHQQGHRAAPDVPEEEPALPFEAGTDEFPDDDSDLAADDLGEFDEGKTSRGPVVKEAKHPLRTGDLISLDEYATPIRVRVNLKTGMIEGQTPLSEAWDIDIRQASPFELGQERERVADFDAEPDAQQAEAAQESEDA